ncbi:hypothetical protein SAMN06295879_0249 [Agreia bicolorata]|uniref:Uncharacterized protein n=2 Tax=Agreia bicolorata TaxID=110935 RepID=A0A1T4WW44_9MICO|nr:hypothetical protein SAMN06295879_0249 [Agreia bicolorata]
MLRRAFIRKEIMLLSALVILGGICIGFLTGGSRIPETRFLPTVSSFVATAALAAILFVVEPANLGAALLLVLVTVGTSVLYAAWLWKKRLDSSVSYGWIVRQEFLRPSLLRSLDEEQLASADASLVESKP